MVRKHNTLFSLALVAVVVLLVRLVFSLVYTPDVPFGKDSWLSIARNVVDGQGYSMPDDRGTTAHRGPIVVYFFAAVLWLFGDGIWPIIIAQWLADVGTSILLFFIALEVFKDRRVAFVSSLLFAFYGPGISFTMIAVSEPVFTLVLAGFTLSLLRALQQPLIWRFALSGILLGLATLARPIMQFYPLIVLPLMFWALDRRWRMALPSFAVLFVVFAMVLLPWIVRNYLIFHTFIPASSSQGGGALYKSYFALGEPDYLRYRSTRDRDTALIKVLEPRFGPAAPGDSDKLAGYVGSKGLSESEVNQIARQEGIKAIRAYPGRAVIRSLENFSRLLFGLDFTHVQSTESYLLAVINSTLLGLAVATFVFFRGAWLWLAVPLIVLVGFNTGVYTVVLGTFRYSVPIMPYIMIFAARTIVHLLPSTVHLWQPGVPSEGKEKLHETVR